MGGSIELKICLLILLIMVTPTVGVVNAQVAPTPPREQTLVVGGGMWSPPTNFNPLVPWAATTGTIGLIYETLYLYLPHNNTWVPWLADGMFQWLNDTALQIRLRDAYWWDGRPLTSRDVRFTFYDVPELSQWSVPYSSIRNYLLRVDTPDNRTAIFIFNRTTVSYPTVLYYLYNIPILPEHVVRPVLQQKGSGVMGVELLGADKPVNIIASGPYRIYATTSDTLWLIRDDNWWGKKYFGLPGPKYVKYVMVFSNQVALAMLTAGDLDWSNFFMPGIPSLAKQYNWLVTWYKDRPYYLPANVAYLMMNHAKKPFNDPAFRKAVYYAIDLNRIVDEVYEGAVLKANPVGLIEIPGWKDLLATDLIAMYNYTYDPAKAKSILDAAGYKVGPDGWRRMPDGTPIVVKIAVPYGWTDWMQAAIIVAQNLQAVGINAQPDFPAYGVYADQMYKGEFDMLINNFGSFVEVTPYNLYNWLLWPDAPPAGQYSWSGNFGRYFNDNATRVLNLIANTSPSNVNTLKQLYRELQQILLSDMPYIPLWYNAYWYQASTRYWTGWPTSDNPYGVPVTWAGRWHDGGLLVLLNLKPVTRTTPVMVVTTYVPTIIPTTVVTMTGMPTTVVATVTAPTAAAPSGMPSELIAAVIIVAIVVLAALYLILRRRS